MATNDIGQPQKVAFYGVTNTADDVVQANLVATMERGYVSFNHLMDSVQGGPVSIVGSGPSLKWTYKDLVGDVLACNSAHDFLIEQGIVPKYAMIWDANPVIAKFVTKPHKGVKYLVASRCHPSVFEALQGYDVTVWHALGGGDVEALLNQYGKQEPMVAGGSAGVTRGIFVMGAIGYREMHLFGADCCYEEDSTHVTGSVIDQKRMRLRICGKFFDLAPWMAMQAGDFKLIVPQLQDRGVKFVVHGTGLIPHIATFMDCETPDLKVTVYEKLKRKVHAVLALFIELRNTPQLLGGSNAGV